MSETSPREKLLAVVLSSIVVLSSMAAGVSLLGTAVTAAGNSGAGFTQLDVEQNKGSGDERLVVVNWTFDGDPSVDSLVVQVEDSNNETIATTLDDNPQTFTNPDDPGNTSITFLQKDLNSGKWVRVTQVLTNGSTYKCVGDYTNEPLVIGDFSCSLSSGGETANITTSSGTTAYTEGGGAVVIDDSLAVNGSSYDSFKSATVSINEGFAPNADDLGYDSSVIPTDDNGNKIITGKYNSTTGVLNFTGTASVSTYQSLLQTVTYNNTENPPATADRNITFTLTAADQNDSDVYYNPATGHYYEYVQDRGVSWSSANSSAANRTYAGMSGYLATVTSGVENEFLYERFQRAGWLGATDTAAEGEWRWVTGPEGNEAGGDGRYFFNQTAAHVAYTDPYPAPPDGVPGGGTAVGSNYSNWSPRNEPDNKFPFFNGQDYAYFCYGPGSCPAGTWKDASTNSPPFASEGYFVEYGGPNVSPNSQTVNLTDFKIVTVSPDTSDSGDPTANAAANSTSVQPGEAVKLDASGSSDSESSVARYEWDIDGNGRTNLTGLTNTTSFDNASDYNVTLTVTDEGSNTDTDNVTISVEDTNPPDAVISVNGSTTVARGETVEFTGTNSTDDSAIQSFEWDFGDGSANSSGVSPIHGYDEKGTYTVAVTVNDTANNTDSDTLDITVESSNRPNISAFDATTDNGSDLNVSITADQQLDTITVDVFNTSQLSPRANDSDALEFTLTEANFTETASNGNFTYTNTSYALGIGNYTARLQQAANDSDGDSGTGQEDTVELYATEGIIYVNSDGYLSALTTDGTVLNYSVDDVKAVGPRADLDGDGTREVPYVDSNNDLGIAQKDGSMTVWIDDSENTNVQPKKSGTRMAVGDWDEDGNYDVFFIGSNSKNIHRIDKDETNQQEELGLTKKDAQFIVASTDITGDDVRDVIYHTGSALRFVNGTGSTGDVKIDTGDSIGQSQNKGIGELEVFTDVSSPNQSDYKYPVIDSNQDVSVWANTDDGDPSTNGQGKKLIEGGSEATKTTPTGVDWTGDGIADHIYVNSNGKLNYTQHPDVGSKAGYVTAGDGPISPKQGPGLASRVSSFESRESLAQSPSAADTTDPSVTLNQPDGDESLTAGNSFTIEWSASDSETGIAGDGIDLEYSADDGSTWSDIVTGTSDDGSYSWTVPSDNTDTARVRVNASDDAGNTGTDTSPTFSIATNAPAFTGSTPKTKNVGTDQFDIEVKADEAYDAYYVVQLSSTSEPTVSEVKSGTAGDGSSATASGTKTGLSADESHNFTATGLSEETSYDIYAVAEDSNGNANKQSTTETTSDGTPPGIANDNISLTNPQDRDLSVTVTSNESLSTVEITLTNVTGSNNTVVRTLNSTNLTETDNGDGTFTYDNTSTVNTDGTYEANITVAEDAAGNDGADSQSDTTTVDTTAPPTPAGLTATAVRDGDIEISFDDVDSGTDRYTIYRNDTTTGSGYSNVTAVSDDNSSTYTYTDTGGTDGISYDYTVSATDDAGNEGTNTTAVAATADATPPGIDASNASLTNPQNRDLTVTVTSNESLSTVEITLKNVTGSNNTVIRTLNSTNLTETDNGDGTFSYDNTSSVAADGTYEANVTIAKDAAGNDGADSQSDTTTVDTSGPPAPTGTTVTALSGGDIDLSFDDTDDGTSYYTVYRNDTSTGSGFTNLTTITDDDSSTYTYTDTGGTDGTTYDYKVSATDSDGNEGTNSSVATTTADATPPGIDASNVSLTNPQNKDLTVTVTSNESLSTVEITLTNVTGSNNTVVRTLNSTNLTETDNGDGTFTYDNTSSVAADGTYEANVTVAEDAAGNDGADSQSDTTTIDTTGPPIPSGLTATAVRDGDIEVGFDDVDSGTDRYTIYRNDTTTGSGYVNITAVSDDNSSTYTYTDTGGTDSVTYDYTVSATDNAGNEGANTTAVAATADATPPGIDASNASLTNPQNKDLTVTVTSNESLSTVEITLTNVTGSNNTVVRTLNSTNLTETDNGDGTFSYDNTSSVAADGTYEANVTVAEDAAGNDGADSQSDTTTVDTTGPPAPTGVTVDNQSGGDIEITFGDVDSGTDHYTVYRNDTSTGGGYDNTTTIEDDNASTYTYTDTGTTDGTEYDYRISATDGVNNEGTNSSTATTVADATAPDIDASNVSLTNPQERDLTVTVTSNESLATINVTLTNVTGSNNTVVRTLDSTNLTETDNGDGTFTYDNTSTVSSDGTYEANVTVAEDAAGNNGAENQNTTVNVDTTGPTAPTGTTTDEVSGGDIEIGFDDTDDGTSYYTIYRNNTSTGSGFVNITTVVDDDSSTYTYTDTGGTGGTTYDYKISATDNDGNEGANSSIFSATADATPPGVDDSNVTLKSPQGKDLTVTVTSNESLSTVEVTLTNTTGSNNTIVRTLNGTTLTETDNGDGTFTYENTSTVNSDGIYEANVTVAEDAAGNDGADSQSDTTTVDTTGPSASSNVAATARAGGDIEISFDDTDDGTEFYTIYRNDTSTGSGFANLTTITDDNTSTYTYTDTTGADGTTYDYKVSGTDAETNEGANSSAVSTTADATLPGIDASNVSLTNPQNKDLTVTVTSNESLSTVEITLTNVTGSNNTIVKTLDSTNLTETDEGDGTFTYENTSSVATDGTYEANVTIAKDAAGNDGADSQSDTTTVDTVVNFDLQASDVVAGPITNTNKTEYNVTVALPSTHEAGTMNITLSDGSSTVTTTEDVSADQGSVTVSAIDASTLVDGSVDVIANFSDGAGNAIQNSTAVTKDTVTDVTLTEDDIHAGQITGSNETSYSVDVDLPDTHETGSLNVTVSDGNKSVTKTVNVSVDSTVDNAPDTVTVSNIDTSGLADGTDTVTATFTDSVGNIERTTVNVTKNTDSGGGGSSGSEGTTDVTDPTADAGNNLTVTEGETVTLTGESSTDNAAIDSYDWDTDGDGTTEVKGETATTSFDSAGTYAVTLTVADAAGNTDTDTVTVTVTKNNTVPTPNIDTNQTIEVGTPLRLDAWRDRPNGTYTYEWELGDGTTATGENVTHVYTAPGTYPVELTVSRDGAQASDTQTVTVTDTDAGLTGFRVESGGETVTITVATTRQLRELSVRTNGTDTTTLTQDAFSVSESDDIYTYTSTRRPSGTGTYTAALVSAVDTEGTDLASGESDTVQLYAARASAKGYVVSAGSSLRFDAGNSVLPEGVAATYEWDIGGNGTVEHTGESVTHDFENPGTHNVSLTVRADGRTWTDTMTIQVEDRVPPAIQLNVSRTVQNGSKVMLDASESSDSVGIERYKWSLGDGTVRTGSNLTTLTHRYGGPGRYTVSLTATDAAGNTATNTTTVRVLGPKTVVPTTAVKFGQTPVNATNASTITVRNNGTVPLAVQNVSIRGSQRAEFSVGGNISESRLVSPGESVTLDVAFTPIGAGAKTATLSIRTNHTDHTVPLGGTGIEASLSTNRTALAFEPVPLRTEVTRSVAIQNTGQAPINLGNVTVVQTGDAFTASNAPTTVPPNTTETVRVSFAPQTPGEHAGTIAVSNATGTTVLTVPVAGTGQGPSVSTSRSSIEFGEVGREERDTAQVTLDNSGTEPLAVREVVVTGPDAGQFDVEQAPDTVPPGAAGAVELAFEPDAVGTDEARLSIRTNSTQSPTSVSLSGEVIAPQIGVSPRTVNFDNIGVGETGYLEITVENLASSRTDLSVEQTLLTGESPEPFAVVSGGAPFTMAPGETRQINLSYSPTDPGEKDAQLQIHSDASNAPQINVWLSSTNTYVVVQEVADTSQQESDTTVSDSETVSVEARNIQDDERLSVNVSQPSTRRQSAGVDILNMTINDAPNFDINVTHARQPVGGTAASYGNETRSVVQYIRLNHSTDADATYEDTEVDFRVRRDRLPDGTAPERVVLHRYANTTWNRMSLERTGQSRTHYHYVAETPGFSQFAVTAPETGTGDEQPASGASETGGSGGNTDSSETESTTQTDGDQSESGSGSDTGTESGGSSSSEAGDATGAENPTVETGRERVGDDRRVSGNRVERETDTDDGDSQQRSRKTDDGRDETSGQIVSTGGKRSLAGSDGPSINWLLVILASTTLVVLPVLLVAWRWRGNDAHR